MFITFTQNNIGGSNMELVVNTELGNYYGNVEVYTKDGKYYLTLENYDRHYGVEISEKLAMAIKEEFEEEKEIITVM